MARRRIKSFIEGKHRGKQSESLKNSEKNKQEVGLKMFLMTLKWTLIIKYFSGAYYCIEPFLSKYLDLMKGLTSGVENIGQISNHVNSATSPDLLKKVARIVA